MADNSNNNTQAPQQPLKPNPTLKRLDRLVGTWEVSDPTERGVISGRTTFEWLEGGFFLVQHVDLAHEGQRIKGL